MAKIVFFAANDGEHGIELWVTDGTANGTRMVKDILPPEANPFNDPYFDSSDPSYIVPIGGGRVLFRAQDENFRRTELWVSDGTEAGTALLIDLDPNSSATPSHLTPLGDGRVVFSASGADDDGTELWITDGTAAGTQKLKSINLNEDYPYSSHPYGFKQVANGRLIFTADDGSNGRELWTTDGTPDGTHLLKEINVGPGGSSISTHSYLDLSGGRVAFSAYDGTSTSYWVTDGTSGGTYRLGGSEFTTDQNELPGGRLLIKGEYNDGKTPFYVSDGTVDGTVEINTPPNVSGPPPSPFFFELGADEGLFPVDPQNGGVNLPQQQLGDGRLLFSVKTEEIREIAGSDGTIYETRWSYGDQLWVTDGSQGGTQLVQRFNMGNPWPDQSTLPPGYIVIPPAGDQEEFEPHSAPHDFFLLPNGKVALVARTAEDQSDLYITDGSSGGTFLVSGNVTNVGISLPWSDSTVVFVVEQGDAPGIWRTDGTSNGTHLLVPNGSLSLYSTFDSAVEIDNGEWLIDTYTSQGNEVWLIDAEAETARKVLDGQMTFEMQNYADVPLLTSMGDGKYLTSTRTGDVGIWEPWILDVNAGTFEVLKDINPGTASGQFGYPVAVTPADQIPIPVSTLFPVKVSLEEQASSFDLDDYFTDPTGSPLNYIVTGTPDEITVNAATSVITAAETVEAGDYAITVTARNPEGGTVTSNLDWAVVDTGNLTIATTGDWGREVGGETITATMGAILTIGRKDGTAQLFRVEPLDPSVPGGPTKPVAKIEHGKITLEGKLFSEQVSTTKPLMEGKFTIDMTKVEVSNFEDANSNTDYRMVADLIDFTFADINIGTNQISFRTDMAFDDGGGTGPSYNALSTKNAPLSLSFGADGVGFGASVGTERWSPDPIEFDLGGGSAISIGFSDLGVDYEAAADAVFVNGKATVSWGGAIENGFNFIDNDSESSLTIDLFGKAQQNNFYQRGDKFLKLTSTPTGLDWDVVGEIKYEDKYEGTVPAAGFLVKELVVGFDTIQDKYSGSFKANIPLLWGLDLSAGVGFVKNPDLALDNITIGVDKINYPIGTTGIFVQGGTLALENLAAADPTAGWTYKAAITGTFGPDNAFVKSPLHGKIEGSIKETMQNKNIGYILTGKVELESKVGYFLPDVVNDLAEPLIDYFGVNAADVTNFELLKATSTTILDLTKDRSQFDTNISLLNGVVVGSAKIINAANATIKDARDISGSLSASLIIPDAFPLGGGMTRSGNAIVKYSSDGDFSNDLIALWSQITVPLLFTQRIYAFGVELKFNGDYKFLGRKDIPKISSWALDEDDGLVFLTARWENADTSAQIEIITPDGLVLTEADIATRDDIALVDDLNTSTSRHVAIENPTTGIWDLRLAVPAGLGEITYEANEMLASAVAPIASLTPDDENHQATIVIDLDAGAAEMVDVVIFAAQDTGQLAGIELARETVSSDSPTLATTLDYGPLGPGGWFIYTRTSAEGLAPVVRMHPTPLTITGSADLSTTARQAIHSPSGAQVMTITVVNEGDRASAPGILTIEVPPEMIGGEIVPELSATPLSSAETELALPALAPGAIFTVAISMPAGAQDLEDAIFVDAWTPDMDADPTDNSFGQVLHVSQLGSVDQYLGGSEASDALIGDGGNDTLIGGSGDDILIPGSGTDTVEGGDGISDMMGVDYTAGQRPDQELVVDLEVGTSTNDGYGNTDTLVSVEDILGTRFGDTILGDDMPNLLIGAEGNDLIDGRAGNDLVWGGAGNDTLKGGTGFDVLLFGTAGSSILAEAFTTAFPALPLGDQGASANLTTGVVTDEFGDTDTISGFENIIGSGFSDHFTGTAFDNYLIGETGADTLVGLAGEDTLEGDEGADLLDAGDGDDRLEGGIGDDTLLGGSGDDYAAYFSAASGVIVDLSLEAATDDGDGGQDKLVGIENIFGSLFDDILTGDENDNRFTALDGDDLIYGGEGFDTVYYGNATSGVNVDLQSGLVTGGEGSDYLTSIEIVQGSHHTDQISGDGNASILYGLGGDDTINGQDGADWLLGGRGNDLLDGGEGNDTAVFSGSQSSFTLTMSPTDIIITDRNAAGDGTDTLVSIEELDFDQNIPLFADGPMPFDIFSGPTGLESDEFFAIVELYIAYFNRAPDAIGLNYWATDYTKGFTLPRMATSFFGQPETRATYANVLDENFNLDITDAAKVGAFVTEVYANVLGRTPDTPGFNYWTDELTNNPNITPSIFILSIIGGAKYPSNPTPQTAIDQIYLANKADLGAYFAVIKGMSDIEDAKDAMAVFDGSPTSLTATVAAIDNHYADAIDPTSGDFLMPLIGVIADPFMGP